MQNYAEQNFKKKHKMKIEIEISKKASTEEIDNLISAIKIMKPIKNFEIIKTKTDENI